MKKKLLTLLVLCLAAVTLLATGAFAADDTLTGSCGEGVTWTATKNDYRNGYDMVIYGTGASSTEAPLTIGAPDFGESDLTAQDIVTLQIGASVDYNTYAIAENAFDGFTNLDTLTIYHVDLTSIGKDAFADCANLSQFNYHGDDVNWSDVSIADGNDYLLAHQPQPNCEFTLTDGNGNTWSIKYNNFTVALGREATATITKGSGTGVVATFPGIDRNIIYSQNEVTELIIGDGITEYNAESVSSRLDGIKEITIGNDLITIGEDAFYNPGNSELTVTFEEGSQLKTVGKLSFSFSGLTSITLPDSVETIGDGAFSNCQSLTSINIPDGVISIGGGAFSSCKALTNISIPDSVTTIGNSAFAYCSSLNSITLGSGVESIGTYAFQSCTALTNISIINSVTGIGTGTFIGCTSLETLTLGSGVETIGNNAFQGCSQLKDFTLPSGLKSIGDNAFNGCTTLTSVSLPDSVTSLGAGAYQNCTGLTSVTLSKTISTLNASTFAGCTGITVIELPDLINRIDDNAFKGCSKLEKVTAGIRIQFVGASVFDGCSSSLTVYGYDGSYMEDYCDEYKINFVARTDIPATGAGIANITSETGTNPSTGKPCTIVIITLTNGTTQRYYVDNITTNSVEDITSAPGLDQYGRRCTVITVTMTDGSTEKFYVYDNDESGTAPVFSDVPANSYYSGAVAWAVANGVTSGTSDTTFSPNADCSRAQVVTFLWRAMGSPEPTGSASGFNDVPAGSYYSKAVRWALEKGITSGVGGGSFGSNSTVTRAEVVTFLWRAAGSPVVAGSSFSDVSSSAYYANAVRWAVANGITDGTSASTFSPNAGCTRAQIVTFLYRYFT